MDTHIHSPSLPVNQRRLSTQAHRQHQGSSPSRLGGFLSNFFGQSSEVQPPAQPPSPPPPERKTTFRLQDYLPQALEEKTITDSVYQLQVHLEGHVNHYYSLKPIPRVFENTSFHNRDMPSMDVEQGYSSIERASRGAPASRNSSYTQMSSSGHMISSSVSPAEERRCKNKVHVMIADRLVRAIQPAKAGDDPVFLPMEITNLLSMLPKSEEMEDDQVFNSALSQWRTLSWYLLYHKKVRKANQHLAKRRLDKEIDHMLKVLDKDLEPYIDASKNEDRREHLRSLMELTAEIGEKISSQGTTYEFSWSYERDDGGGEGHPDLHELSEARSSRDSHRAPSKGRRPRSLKETSILFPALLKTSDRHGIHLTKPVCICEPQVDCIRMRLSKRKTDESYFVEDRSRVYSDKSTVYSP